MCISDETLQTIENNFNVERAPTQKTRTVKSFHKSENNRSQVIYKKLVDCEKLS